MAAAPGAKWKFVRRSRKCETMAEKGTHLLDRLAAEAGHEDMAHLVQLWRNWAVVMGEDIASLAAPMGHSGSRIVVGAVDNVAMQEASFWGGEIVERANAFMGRPYFSDCQVRLILDRPAISLDGGPVLETEADLPPAPQGTAFDAMDPASPVTRAYGAYAGRAPEGGWPVTRAARAKPAAPAATGAAPERFTPDAGMPVLDGSAFAGMDQGRPVERCYRAFMASDPRAATPPGCPPRAEGADGSHSPGRVSGAVPDAEPAAPLTGEGLAVMDGDSPVAMAYRAFVAGRAARAGAEATAGERPAVEPETPDGDGGEARAFLDGFERGAAAAGGVQERATPARLTGRPLEDMDPDSGLARCYVAYMASQPDLNAIGALEGEGPGGPGAADGTPPEAGRRAPRGLECGFHTGQGAEGAAAAEGDEADEPVPELTGLSLDAMDTRSSVRGCYAAWVARMRGEGPRGES